MRALYLEVRNLCAKFIYTLATKKYHNIIFWGSFDSPTFRKVLNLCLVILSGPRLNQAGWKCVCAAGGYAPSHLPCPEMVPRPYVPAFAHSNSE